MAALDVVVWQPDSMKVTAGLQHIGLLRSCSSAGPAFIHVVHEAFVHGMPSGAAWLPQLAGGRHNPTAPPYQS